MRTTFRRRTTTSSWASAGTACAALLCAWKAFGADHLVAGSDYPVLMAFETYRQTFHYIRECGLPVDDVDKILEHNAQRVLGLPH